VGHPADAENSAKRLCTEHPARCVKYWCVEIVLLSHYCTIITNKRRFIVDENCIHVHIHAEPTDGLLWASLVLVGIVLTAGVCLFLSQITNKSSQSNLGRARRCPSRHLSLYPKPNPNANPTSMLQEPKWRGPKCPGPKWPHTHGLRYHRHA